jgi:peptidoglycan/xylan/chitin deacetylase (PgdA/CDA1 family)
MQKLFWGGVIILVLGLAWFKADTKPHGISDRSLEESYTKDIEGPFIQGSLVTIGPKGARKVRATPEEQHSSALAEGGTVIKLPIMIYHSVRPHIQGESKYQDIYDVTPELFESELTELESRGFTTVTFKDLDAYLSNGQPLPARAIILSFDDGWRNQYTYAYPLLKKHRMKGTFFIFSGAIGSRDAFMNWDQVKEMHDAGMEISGHSYTHPMLPKVYGEKELYRELSMSKTMIEEHIGEPVTAFAYPFGMYDKRIVSAVKNAGYHIARTTKNSVWHSSNGILTINGTLSSDSIDDFTSLLSE